MREIWSSPVISGNSESNLEYLLEGTTVLIAMPGMGLTIARVNVLVRDDSDENRGLIHTD